MASNSSHLRYITKTTPQRQATVKFHGVFASHWKSLAFAPGLEYSGESSLGQWRSRYTIHAGRHSNDKAFRYLKRVIVTPAVYQLFTPLKRSLKYWHWADITFYTKLYSIAEG